MREQPITVCMKCGGQSGDDWSRCEGRCPVPCSPHYDPELEAAIDAYHEANDLHPGDIL